MNIPYFEQWLGIWAMREEEFLAGHGLITGMDVHLHLQGPDPEQAKRAARESKLQVTDGVALVTLHGTLMKQQSSMGSSTSTVLARRLIRQAMNSGDVGGALVHIDSPGGTAAGTQALADDIAALAKKKPTVAYIEDLGASAAFWAASQAGKVIANGSALVGSIGTYGVVHDLSARAALQGVKVHVVRAGAMKGAGVAGTEITSDVLAEHQRIVNNLNDFFVRGVASGRGLSIARARELADGRIHIADEAREMGLIDGVQSLDATWSKLVALVNQGKTR